MCMYVCVCVYVYTPVKKENVERSADTSTKYARADGLSGCIVYYELFRPLCKRKERCRCTSRGALSVKRPRSRVCILCSWAAKPMKGWQWCK